MKKEDQPEDGCNVFLAKIGWLQNFIKHNRLSLCHKVYL